MLGASVTKIKSRAASGAGAGRVQPVKNNIPIRKKITVPERSGAKSKEGIFNVALTLKGTRRLRASLS